MSQDRGLRRVQADANDADDAAPAVAGSGHGGPVTVTTTIRPARPPDATAILAVVADAFSYGGIRDPNEELAIVRGTWTTQKNGPLIELVADENGTIVGHLQAAPGSLDGEPTPVAGVAPVCVGTQHQRSGIGSALMAALIDAATDRHWPLLVLLGDPAYYGRFGFEPAAPLGLSYPPVGTDNPHFQARKLPGYAEALRGEFSYCWEKLL
jgi:putative acetyltransferase